MKRKNYLILLIGLFLNSTILLANNENIIPSNRESFEYKYLRELFWNKQNIYIENTKEKPPRNVLKDLKSIREEALNEGEKEFLIFKNTLEISSIPYTNEILELIHEDINTFTNYSIYWIASFALMPNYTLEICNKAIENFPESILLYNYRGMTYLTKLNFQEAFNDYSKAFNMLEYEINKNLWHFEENVISQAYAHSFFHRGIASFGLGLYNQSLKYYTKAINLNPQNGSYYFERSKVIATLNNGTQASDFLKDILTAIYLGNKDALNWLTNGEIAETYYF